MHDKLCDRCCIFKQALQMCRDLGYSNCRITLARPRFHETFAVSTETCSLRGNCTFLLKDADFNRNLHVSLDTRPGHNSNVCGNTCRENCAQELHPSATGLDLQDESFQSRYCSCKCSWTSCAKDLQRRSLGIYIDNVNVSGEFCAR